MNYQQWHLLLFAKNSGKLTLSRVRNFVQLLRYIAYANVSSRALKSEASLKLSLSPVTEPRDKKRLASYSDFTIGFSGSGFSGTEDALFNRRNTATRSASKARRPGFMGCILPMQRMSLGRARIPSSFP